MPSPIDQIKASIDLFCRLHKIDPASDSVLEFRVAIIGELSRSHVGAEYSSPGQSYIDRHRHV